MVVQEVEYVTRDKLDEYITQAAKAAGYEQGFGINGCDLSQAIYRHNCRQERNKAGI